MLEAVLAAGPLVVAIFALLALRRSASTAGALGCLVALALVLLHPAFRMPLERLGEAVLRGLLVTLLVAYIVFFGLLLYELMARGGAIARLAAGLATVGGSPAARTLLLCLPLGAFFEAASGFGVGIVVVAPLLLALGHPPQRAALLALLTQNAVPWGALAVGTLLGAELAGLSSTTLGLGCAYLSLLLFPYFAVLALLLDGGPAALRANLALAVGLSVLMALAAWGVTLVLGAELAMVVGAPLVAGTGLAWLGRTSRGARAAVTGNGPALPLWRALAPYAMLVGGLLASRLVGPLRPWLLENVVLAVPTVSFSLPLLYSPGFWLALAGVVAVPVLGLSGRETAAALRSAWRRWVPASLSLAAFLVLSELMLRSGMTPRLAAAAADALGPAYVAAAPFVGGLGGFLTGSNAAGNAMFMGFQLQMAEQLGVPVVVLAAVQNTAGAALSLASPQRVVLAVAVVGLVGKEGDLMRRALLIGAGVILLIIASELGWLVLGGNWPG